MPVPRGSWVPVIPQGPEPIYLRIASALARDRADGILHPGDRLPPQRVLADALSVDLTTITRAYAEARRRDIIDAVPGRGTFVTAHDDDRPAIDLSMNIPPPPAGLNLPALISAGVADILRRSSADALLSYHSGPGSARERGAGAAWLERALGYSLPIDRIALGAGAQALLAAIVISQTREDDVVLTDRLTYPGFIALAHNTGRRLVGVDADGEGIRPDAVAAAIRRHGSRLLYLNPTLHNPTVRTMPAARRRDIADLSTRLGFRIIEDDPYRALLGDSAPVPVAALAPDSCFYVATLCKVISPVLRTAFMAAPSPSALGKVAAGLHSVSLMAPPLMTRLAAEWIASGTTDAIIAAVRREVRARYDLAVDRLPPRTRIDPHGFHAWLELPPGRRAWDVVAGAQLQAMAISPAASFHVDGRAPEALRIALGAVPSRDKLAVALERLATTIDAGAPSGGPVV